MNFINFRGVIFPLVMIRRATVRPIRPRALEKDFVDPELYSSDDSSLDMEEVGEKNLEDEISGSESGDELQDRYALIYSAMCLRS